MNIIISNTVQLKFSPFIKFIREEYHQLKFITTIVRKSLLYLIYMDIKQALNFWWFQVVTGYHIKAKLDV